MSHATHHSHWVRQTPPQLKFPPPSSDQETEVLVIGAGIAGLTTAIELLHRGKQVIVCEAATIGSGTTGGSSGHLDAHPEMGTAELLGQLGEDDARAYTQMRLEAIREISKRGSSCDYQTVPAYYYTEQPDNKSQLQKSYTAGLRIGLRAQWMEQVPIAGACCGYRCEDFGRIDVMKYLQVLSQQVIEQGGTIYENALVSGPVDTKPTQLRIVDGPNLRFQQVACCVHSNFTDSMRLYLETPAYQSYCLVARVSDPPEDALFWDDSDPYFYTRRLGTEENLILVGGCDHRTGAGDSLKAQAELAAWVQQRFDVSEIVSQWSAELFEPTDGLPMIGAVAGKENVWITTGLSGVGLTLGTASGKIIANLICGGKPSELVQKLSPARFALSGVATLIGEQGVAAANLAERVLPAEELEPALLQPGEGKVGKVDGKFVAICRDKQGCHHRHSPICTHMGGVVHWNEAAQTWDCPVHGGRFAPDGSRIYGPPEQPLDAE